jgi:hypothetical protein
MSRIGSIKGVGCGLVSLTSNRKCLKRLRMVFRPLERYH